MGKFGRLVKRVTGVKKLGGGSRSSQDADSDDPERVGAVDRMPPRWEPPVSPPAPRGDAPAGASSSSEEASPPDPRSDKLAALLRQGVRIDASSANPLAAVSRSTPFPAAPSRIASPIASPSAVAASVPRVPATAQSDAASPFASPLASPTASPTASPLASPLASPDASAPRALERARRAATSFSAVADRAAAAHLDPPSEAVTRSEAPEAPAAGGPDLRASVVETARASRDDRAVLERAAVTLQSHARGLLARAAARRRRAARRAASLREARERERAAATRIQAWARGRAARRFAEMTRFKRNGERRVAAIEAELAALRAAVVANAAAGGPIKTESPEVAGDWRRAFRAATPEAVGFERERADRARGRTPSSRRATPTSTAARRASDGRSPRTRVPRVASDASPSVSGDVEFSFSPPDPASSAPGSSSPEAWRSPASNAGPRRDRHARPVTAAKRRAVSPGSRVVAAAEALARRYHESPLWDWDAGPLARDGTEEPGASRRAAPVLPTPPRDARRARAHRETHAGFAPTPRTPATPPSAPRSVSFLASSGDATRSFSDAAGSRDAARGRGGAARDARLPSVTEHERGTATRRLRDGRTRARAPARGVGTRVIPLEARVGAATASVRASERERETVPDPETPAPERASAFERRDDRRSAVAPTGPPPRAHRSTPPRAAVVAIPESLSTPRRAPRRTERAAASSAGAGQQAGTPGDSPASPPAGVE